MNQSELYCATPYATHPAFGCNESAASWNTFSVAPCNENATHLGFLYQQHSESNNPETARFTPMMQMQHQQHQLNGSPFSPNCRIPLPHPFSEYHYQCESTFIRKRNERERERVRCVNEGYDRLKEHLPIEHKEKRISKVEILKCAIRYINYLQNTLDDVVDEKTLSSVSAVHVNKLLVEKDSPTKSGHKRVSVAAPSSSEKKTKAKRKLHQHNFHHQLHSAEHLAFHRT